MSAKESERWQTLSRRELLDARPWLRVWAEDLRLPDGRIVEGFYTLEMPGYVQIVALTRDDQVVVVRQYKHGVGREGLHLPAGYVEPGEDPLHTASRELLEETGYEAEEWRFLGSFVTDGNRGSGTAHIYLARDARHVAAPDSHDLEQMEILLMPLDDLTSAVTRGEVPLLSTLAALGAALIATKMGVPLRDLD